MKFLRRIAIVASVLLTPLVAWGAFNEPPIASAFGTGVYTALRAAAGALGGILPIGGTLTPGDCLQAGSGTVVDAGAACSTGGTTTYATHALLTAGVTGNIGNTLSQAGYSASGDGGAATYHWAAGSYCPGGTSGSPTTADGIVCILPAGQSSSTAGRYLLQVGSSLDVRSIGMAAGGQDNAPYIASLMLALGAPTTYAGGQDVVFPAIPGQIATAYYFTKSLILSRGARYHCSGGPTLYKTVQLIFAAGVDGVIQEAGAYSPDGGAGLGSVDDCAIVSQGYGSVTATEGSNSLTGNNNFNGDLSGSTITASSWSIGDGIVLTPFLGGQATWNAIPAVSPGAYIGNVSGTTLTLGGSYTVNAQLSAAKAQFTQVANTSRTINNGDTFTIGNDTWTAVSVIGSTPGNFLIGSNFLNTGINLANCVNLNTTTATCVAQSTTPNVTADIPTSAFLRFWAATGGTAGNSLASTYTPVGTSAGSFTGSTFAGGVASTASRYIQLPATQGFTVQTTNGVTGGLATAGPRLLVPGDVLWSDAFPLGTTVANVSGTLGNQSFTTWISVLNSTVQLATTTHTSGAPGTMWVIPAGLKRDTSANSNNNSFNYWGIGLEMPCSVGAGGLNCTISRDYGNSYFDDFVARWTSGDNTGGSTSTAEEMVDDQIADLAELGTVGTTYVGLNSESGEGSEAPGGILFNCTGTNTTVIVGGYFGGGSYGGGCVAATGLGPPTLGGPMMLGPNNASPVGSTIINQGVLTGPWKNVSGTYGTTCFEFGTPYTGNWFSFGFSNAQCSTASTWGLGWNSTLSSWDWVFDNSDPVMRYIAGSLGYTGYAGAGGAVPYILFPTGEMLWNNDTLSSAANSARILSMGSAIPTLSSHVQGDTQINTTPVPGGNIAWVDTPAETAVASQSFTTTSGSNTITVTACPTVTPAASTPMVDTTLSPNKPFGTFTSCTTGSLVFTALAAGIVSSGSSDGISFMVWQKEGTVQDTIPAISSCGTGSPSVATGSNNIAGQFTMGTSATTCTITFAHAYPNHAFCTADPASSGGAAITGGYYISATSASAFTLTIGTSTSSLVFNYTCGGT